MCTSQRAEDRRTEHAVWIRSTGLEFAITHNDMQRERILQHEQLRAQDITAAAEQLAFLTNMAEKLGVAKVGFDAPPVTVTVVVAPPPPSASPIIDVDPGRSDEHNSENAADDGPVLELWAVALIAVGGAAALLCLGACCICRRRRGACAAIAATRCKRPSVESCREPRVSSQLESPVATVRL